MHVGLLKAYIGRHMYGDVRDVNANAPQIDLLVHLLRRVDKTSFVAEGRDGFCRYGVTSNRTLYVQLTNPLSMPEKHGFCHVSAGCHKGRVEREERSEAKGDSKDKPQQDVQRTINCG